MKHLEHTTEDERLVALFRALGNPARFRIFLELRRAEQVQGGQLQQQLPLAQSTVSEHIRRLREVGLIVGETDGAAVRYTINEDMVNWMQERIATI
jgi:ArsR family transcriptional regulator, arsenate/arsenite/antimonite-responsive transcriptional repressor